MKTARSATIALSALLCAGLATGCTSTAQSSAPVMLASGTTEGVAWHLWAWEQSGTLCMSAGSATGPDETVSPSPGDVSGGGCEFDQKSPDSSYYTGAEGGGTSTGQSTVSLTFGPLPTQATRIKVASNLTLTTKPFPAGKGLPTGRYWLWAGPYQPAVSIGTVLTTPEPLDDAGKPVAFQAF